MCAATSKQQVIFLSEVLGASRKLLDLRYLKKMPTEAQWSHLNFGNERPPWKDFKFRSQALRQIVPAEGLLDCLRRLCHKGYKIWKWKYNGAEECLL